MANEIKLKKWNGSAWVQQYPEVRHTDIVASGTPSSSNFLRGDGAWANVGDGNTKFYAWRAINNTASSGVVYYKIAHISSQASSRFQIELTGRYAGYGDGDLPNYCKILGQYNNDNNYDVWWFNNETGTSQAVSEVGIVDDGTNGVNIWVKVSNFAEVSATAYISDGTITTYDSNSETSSAPTGYTAITEYKMWNSGNDGSGSGLAADTVDGIHGGSFLRSDTDDSASGDLTFTGDIIAEGNIKSNSPVNTSAPISVKSLSNNRAIHIEETGSGSESWQIGVDTAGNFNLYNSGSSTPSFRIMDSDNVYTEGNVIIDANNNNKKLYIARYGSTSSEFTSLSRDDTVTHIHTKNDESSSTVRFRIENTDTESGGGANANDRNIDFISDATRAQIQIAGERVATENYVDTELASLVASAPSTLDTLNELAAALGDDANFSTTMTNSLAGKLSLSGGTMTSDIKFTNATDIGIENASGNSWYRPEDQYGNTHIEVRSGKGIYVDADTVAFRSQANTDRMRIASNGNVGIGNTNPASKLQVNSTGTALGRFFSTGNGDTHGLYVNVNVTAGDVALDNNVHFASSGSNSGSFTFATGNDERVRIQSNGNVGIGLTNPATELEVDGDIQLVRTKNIIFGETVGGNARARIFSTQNEFASDYNGIGFSTGANGRTNPTMYIRSTNNSVGIGTTTPSQKLQVNGITRVYQASQTALKSYSGEAGLQLVGYQSTSGSPYTKTSDIVANADGTVASQMRLFTKASGDSSATERVRIQSDGNVGIGTTSPTQKLDVNGSIRAANDMYAARYYDLNNTSYYGDFGSTSKFNAVQFQTLQSNKTSYGEPNTENFYRLKIQNQGGTNNDVGIGQTASGNMGYNVTAANAHIFFEGTNGEIARLQPSGLALNHNGTGTVESKSITFTSQTADTDVVRVLKTTSGGNLDFNAGAVSLNGNGNITAKGNLYLNNDNTNTDTFVYFGDSGSDTDHYVSFDTSEQKFNFSNDILVNGSAIGGGGVTSIRNFTNYVASNGTTARQLALTKSLSIGDKIGLVVQSGSTSNYGTRSQEIIWVEVGTSSHTVQSSYYSTATTTARWYAFEVYITSAGALYIDDAVAWTNGSFGHSGSNSSAIYILDVLELA